MTTTPLPLRSEFLFRMALQAGTPQMSAAGGGKELRVVPVIGGTFEGPSLSGTLVPGTTADWLRLEPDGTAHMDVRLVMRTHAGQHFFMQYSGVRSGPPDVLARLGRGEAVEPDEYYFRIAIRFETSDPELAWLNRVLGIGVGQRPPAGPTYDVYAIR